MEPANTRKIFSGTTTLGNNNLSFPVRIALDDAIHDGIIDNLIKEQQNGGIDDSFYVLELDAILRLCCLWRETLPRVEPFYAVKVNHDPAILYTLASLGVGFDCASKDEIQRVLEIGDVNPNRIIYAHPCKQITHLQYAVQNGISLATFDNEDELHKIRQADPTMQLLLRIQADDPLADWKMGIKFGATLEEGKRLLSVAAKMELNVLGISFHVGSGCRTTEAFSDAIADAKTLFDYTRITFGYCMKILDIGGGFPGSSELQKTFKKFGNIVNNSLEEYFPTSSGVRIIAEPGRFFAMAPYTLCCSIIARRVLPDKTSRPMYYISDGKYGSLMYYPLEGKGSFRLVRRSRTILLSESDASSASASLWGPTCCGTDCIMPEIPLPEMAIGDWIVFYEMGAYSYTNATTFNGFPKPRTVYVARSRYLSEAHVKRPSSYT
ncbi:ornithine decarboxylase-like [Paramacrobiotus metropolitanus]|uniref:ornithine decarboxylase-like n=1 Tax=Paramacrobiotus metropolitanus TaxID=2943436 RepID=UPI0024457963|nr:ornithine decarboxylase-like [Paramacrobiotus metropolitanus]